MVVFVLCSRTLVRTFASVDFFLVFLLPLAQPESYPQSFPPRETDVARNQSAKAMRPPAAFRWL